MGNQKNNNNANDDLEGYTARLDDLESFKKEYEGEKFYEKIVTAFEKSKTVNDELEKLIWMVTKRKLWAVLLTGLGLILVDLVLRAVPSILSEIGN